MFNHVDGINTFWLLMCIYYILSDSTFSIGQSDRLKHVLDLLSSLNSLCSVLGMDFKHTISQIHPSLEDTGGSNSVSNETIERLDSVIHGLREIKLQRMQKVRSRNYLLCLGLSCLWLRTLFPHSFKTWLLRCWSYGI